jgi:signal transduction histidine kinase
MESGLLQKGQTENTDIRTQRWSLLSNIGRELGNVVTVVSGWVECLENPDCLEPERGEAIKNLRLAIDRLRTALRCMPEVPSDSFHGLAVVDVNDRIRSTLSSLDPRVMQAFEVRQMLDSKLWPVIGDVSMLDFVLVSLIMEAVSIGEPGDRIVVETSHLEVRDEEAVNNKVASVDRHIRVGVRVYATAPRVCAVDVDTTEADCGEPRVPPICRHIVEGHAGDLEVRSSSACPWDAVVILPAYNNRYRCCGHS